MSNNLKKLNQNQLSSLKHVCMVCGKGPVSGYNKPHSLKRTKTVKKPNTQKVRILDEGNNILELNVCTRCMRTEVKKNS